MKKKDQLQTWVKAWKGASKSLELLRREKIQKANTIEAIEALSLNFEWALRSQAPRPISGLVKQQALFQKLRLK